MSVSHWTTAKIQEHYQLNFFDLVQKAYVCHQKNFPKNDFELCCLSSIKTGACPEDCAYCPQSGHYKTGLQKENLLSIGEVIAQAKQAKVQGAKRFCMGAAWKSPPKKDMPAVIAMIKAVKDIGLETCATLGMLDAQQAEQLQQAGLDYYNHNIDTSADYYPKIITTRTYQDRLDTLEHVDQSGMKVCCGGILGMGESRLDRIDFLLALYALPKPPTSIPINALIPIKGTPLADQQPLGIFEFVKTIAIARLMFPKSRIRLAAGREQMSKEAQAFCFMAGVNSIFIGNRLLTAKNQSIHEDHDLFKELDIEFQIDQALEKQHV